MTDDQDPFAHPIPDRPVACLQASGQKPIGFPIPCWHSPRKDKAPRIVSEEGWPVWRVSYSDKATGKRAMTLVAKPNRAWAQVWATKQAAALGWTKLTVGRWHGGLDFSPSPFRASSAP